MVIADKKVKAKNTMSKKKEVTKISNVKTDVTTQPDVDEPLNESTKKRTNDNIETTCSVPHKKHKTDDKKVSKVTDNVANRKNKKRRPKMKGKDKKNDKLSSFLTRVNQPEQKEEKDFINMIKKPSVPGKNAMEERMLDLELQKMSQKDEETSEIKTTKPRKKQKKSNPEPKPVEEEAPEPSAKDKALSYLKLWKEDRSNWSFKKVRNVWLIRHMYNADDVEGTDFSCLLSYLEEAKGGTRVRLLAEAQSLYDTLSADTENGDSVKAERARMVIQTLSE